MHRCRVHASGLRRPARSASYSGAPVGAWVRRAGWLTLLLAAWLARPVAAASPSLSIVRTGDRLAVEWPAEFAAFQPETATNLATPQWSALAGAELVGDRYRVLLPLNPPAALVRLTAPDNGSSGASGIVNTVADLAALDPERLQGVVYVLGFAARSDGLGGVYFATNTVVGANPVTRIPASKPGWAWEAFEPRPWTIYPLGGLNAYVTGGLLASEASAVNSLADAGAVRVAAGQVTLIPGATNYVAADLFDGRLHVWRRMLHDGAVEIGRVVTSSNGVVARQAAPIPRLPASPVERFKRKLAEGRATRVVILGDSLLTQVFPVGWESLLFVPGSGPAELTLKQPILAEHRNYSLGAVGPLYGMAALGETRGQGKPYYVDTRGIGFSSGAFLENFRTDGAEVPIRRSPAVTMAADLAIVGYYNQSPYRLAYIESIVRQLRSTGAEVVLVASGPNEHDLEFRASDGGALAAIAGAYGCALADVNSWMREAYEQGQAVWGDGIHQSALGNQIWARCLRSILNDQAQTPRTPAEPPVRLLFADQDPDARAFPEQCDVVFTPAAHNGTWAAPLTNSLAVREFQNVAHFLGGKPIESSVLVLEPGQHAIFSHAAALTLDFLIEADSGASYQAEVRSDGQSRVIKSLATSWPAAVRPQVIEWPGLNLADCRTLSSSGYGGVPVPDLANPAVSIVNTGTTPLRLVGALFGTLAGRELAWSEWTREGLFSSDGGYWTFRTLGTDVVGSSLTASFFGRGMQLVLQGGQHAGQVRVQVDGQTAFTQDGYRPAGRDAFLTATLFPDAAAANSLLTLPRWHTVNISLVGTNEAVVAPTEVGRRHLSLIQALVY